MRNLSIWALNAKRGYGIESKNAKKNECDDDRCVYDARARLSAVESVAERMVSRNRPRETKLSMKITRFAFLARE